MMSVVYKRPHPSRLPLRRTLALLVTLGSISLLSYLILEIRW